MTRLIYTLSAIIFLSLHGICTMIHVPLDYPSIQQAINASVNGDTILVAPGIYPEHLDPGGKNIVLCSNYLVTGDASFIGATILDGSYTGRVLTISTGEDLTCQIIGFTIQNGNSATSSGLTYGGGVLISDASPVISHCVIQTNSAPAFGGGLAITGLNSSARISDCIIRNNTADNHGGGVFMGDCSMDAEIVNCIITRNTLTGPCSYAGGGGGVILYHRGKLVNCLVSRNSAPNAQVGGGGIYCDWGDYYGSQGNFVTGCTIAYNTALSNGGVSDIVNGGEFRNCIIRGNTDSSNSISNINGNSYFYCCSDPMPWGTGNISSNPQFVNPALNNFRLSAGSPCIDAGNDSYNTELFDLDGHPRTFGIIDMGAYEFGSLTESTVQVGSGEDLTNLFPVQVCDEYSYSQQIYLGTEIATGGGTPGYINKIRFRYSGFLVDPSNLNNWTVYLGNTTKTDFSGTSDWVPVSAMTQVFSGTIPDPVDGFWLDVVLSTPFYYSGENLVVAVDENSPGWECYSSWYAFDAVNPRGLLYTGYTNNPDPASPPEANWFPQSYIAQIQFGFSGSYGMVVGYVSRQPDCMDPVVGATVSSGNYNTLTDATGFYRLVLPTGTYFDLTATDGQVSLSVYPVYIQENDTAYANFCLPIFMPPPVQLEASVTGPSLNNVNLTWHAPGTVADQWIHWDNGQPGGSLGYGEMTITFSVASRWSVADIFPFDGTYLKKIRFFPAEGACTYTLKVWKGADASTLLYSQPTSNLNIYSWNEISLTTPVLIDGSEEFWFGYEVTQTTGHPAGVSSGPAHPGNGDMFNQGGTWISVKQAWNYDFDWLLQGFVSESPVPLAPVGPLSLVQSLPQPINQHPGPMLKPMIQKDETHVFHGIDPKETDSRTIAVSSSPISSVTSSAAAVLTGYNVYRNNVLLAGNIPDLFYNNLALPMGRYNYQVSAQYDLGESARIGPVVADIYTCHPPTGLTALNSTLTTTTADLSWTPSAYSTNPEWVLEWGPVGFARGAGTTVHLTTTPGYSLSNLIPGSVYDFYVCTFCSTNDTSIWVKKSFRTRFFDCPVTAVTETEVCGDTINNGCQLQTPVFEAIQCGDIVCGTVWLSGQSRDADWYSFTVTEVCDVTVSALGEFSYRIGFKSPPCPAGGFIANAYGYPGWPLSVTATLSPGTYFVWIAPTFNGNVICDSLSRYQFTLTCSTCLTPTLLSAGNPTSSSADLSWTSGATQWDIEWGIAGFQQGTGTVITGIGQNPYTLTGLTAGYSYQYYVKSRCDGEITSLWAGPCTFFLPCPPTAPPYFEDFSAHVREITPMCWHVSGAGSPVNSVLREDNYAGGASPELTFIPYSSYFSGTSLLLSPVFNTQGYSDLTLLFDQYKVAFNSYTLTELITTSDGGATWQSVWTDNQTGTIGPLQTQIYISNSDVGSPTFQFAFAVTGNSWDLGTWRIDNIFLDGWLHTGTLEGVVTDCTGLNSLEGVTVTAGMYSTSTDFSGYYNFPALPVGLHDVVFSLPGYVTKTVTGVEIAESNTTILDECLDMAGPPVNSTLQDITVGGTQTECYDALEIITVAGGSTIFQVSPGGSATMIAGMMIRYLPGTRVFPGGYLLGKIAPVGPYCNQLTESPLALLTDSDVQKQDASKAVIRVFPNPTTGRFEVELDRKDQTLPMRIEVLGMYGEKILTRTLEAGEKPTLNFAEHVAGVYLVRVTAGDIMRTTKLVLMK